MDINVSVSVGPAIDRDLAANLLQLGAVIVDGQLELPVTVTAEGEVLFDEERFSKLFTFDIDKLRADALAAANGNNGQGQGNT